MMSYNRRGKNDFHAILQITNLEKEWVKKPTTKIKNNENSRERAKNMCVLRLSKDIFNLAACCREACGIGKHSVSPNYLAGPCFCYFRPSAVWHWWPASAKILAS